VIRVKSIEIKEFRGIRSLVLDMGNRNYAVCGPNGTGKSGIVDAIEFGLTGSISRLSGSGTGGLSISRHGPHVDRRDNPEMASVSVTVSIPSLNTEATIIRSVKDAAKPSIKPNSPEVRAIFDRVALYPEFVLSRRELIRYVLAEPGKRNQEVQELLKLEQIESLRKTLQKIANACERDATTQKANKVRCGEQLRVALGIGKLSAADILTTANEKRAILGLPPFQALEATTSLKDGIVTTGSSSEPTKVSKANALALLDALSVKLKNLSSESFGEACASATQAVSALAKDEQLLKSSSKSDFLREALGQFDGINCPVCDTAWDPDHFRRHVIEKLGQFDAVTGQRRQLEQQLQPLALLFEAVQAETQNVERLAEHLQPTINTAALTILRTNLKASVQAIRSFLPIANLTAALRPVSMTPPEVTKVIVALENAVAKLPEPTQQDSAREFLIIAQERLEAYRQASAWLKAAEQNATSSGKVIEIFGTSTTNALNDIYLKVEDRFSKLYRRVNHDDEDKFKALLKPSLGKLGFDVDFYGRGYFPPGAYHSEGHQDGMGLCLYLALMDHLAGDAFTLAVLDDVLMSVDSSHRREVSKLLREEFPKTQFILTTHDEIWLRHMKAVGLVESKKVAHFRTWSVDTGPTEWDDRDVWEEIKAYLAHGDVRSAAALLRHYLEHFSKEACHALRAQVEFRGDAQFSLGDMLPNAIGKLNKLLKKGQDAAKSWEQADKAKATSDQAAQFSTLVTATQVEQWQVNAAVHYNEWADFNRKDFEPVVAAFNALVQAFQCKTCHSLLSSTPDHGPEKALRCICGEWNINLTKK